MLIFCELVSGLILRVTNFGFDAGEVKFESAIFFYKFFKSVSLLVKNIVNLYMCCLKACFTCGTALFARIQVAKFDQNFRYFCVFTKVKE